MKVLECSNRELNGITLGQWVEYRGEEKRILAVDYAVNSSLCYLISSDDDNAYTFKEIKQLKENKDVEFLSKIPDNQKVQWVTIDDLKNYEKKLRVLEKSNRNRDGFTIGDKVKYNGKVYKLLGIDFSPKGYYVFLIESAYSTTKLELILKHFRSSDMEILKWIDPDITVAWRSKEELELVKEEEKTELRILKSSDRERNGISIGSEVIYKNKVETVIGIDFNPISTFVYMLRSDLDVSRTLEETIGIEKSKDIEILEGVPMNTKVRWTSRERLQPIIPKIEATPDNITLHKHEYSDTGKQGIDTAGVIHEKPTSDIKEVCTFAPSSHYEFGDGLNCMTFIEEAVKDLKGIEAFYIANAIKYLFRTTKKNGDDDLKKAYNYITLTLKKRGLL